MAESRVGCCAGEHPMCDYHIGWSDAMDQPASHPTSELSYEDRAYLLDMLKEHFGDPAANRIRAVVWGTPVPNPSMVTIDWGEGPRNIDDNKEASDV